MARMMRAVRWQRATPTYAYDLKGSDRAAENRALRNEIDSCTEDVEEDRRIRECWNFHYSLYPAWYADKILDRYGIPKPPSRSRRMPE